MSKENTKKKKSKYYIEAEPFYKEVVKFLKYRESRLLPYYQKMEEYYNEYQTHLDSFHDKITDIETINSSLTEFPVFPKSLVEFIDEEEKTGVKFDYDKLRYIKTGKFLNDEKIYEKEFVLLTEYFKSIIQYYDEVYGIDASFTKKLPNKPVVQWTDSLAQKFIMIVEGLSRSPNYRKYTFLDEMRQDAIIAIMAYGHNFNYEKYDKPFAYYNMIAWQAFVQRIKKEARERDKRYKYLLSNFTIDDDLFLENGGDHIEALNSIIEMFDEKQKEKSSS